ncbi:hypothetical protein JW823_10195 [bacterium]|nr:hypothetical protein [candidate division CSSED10-310 bacterium]
MNQELRIIILIVAAFAIGLIVLFLVPDYRISQNLTSNADYYPGITVIEHLPGDILDPEAAQSGPSMQDDSSFDPTESPSSRDFEF